MQHYHPDLAKYLLIAELIRVTALSVNDEYDTPQLALALITGNLFKLIF